MAAAERDLPGGAPVRGARPDSPDGEALREALAAAFDYRGDITLQLADGTSLTGYLFSYEATDRDPHVKLYPARDGAAAVRVALDQVVGVELSGDDKATGRSWEAWVKRYEQKKRLQAEGVDVGDIEPKPEPLE